MIKIKSQKANEPYLIHDSRIKIEIPLDSKEIETINLLPSIYTQASEKLLSSDFKKIEVEFCTKWHAFARALYDYGFHRCLTRWELNLKKNPITPNLTLDISTTKKPDFKDLILLLHQQADYHNNLYPNYFKSSHNINWTDYQKFYQKNLDNPPDTICLTYIVKDKVVGLLMGDINKKSANIWELIVDQNFRHGGIGSKLTSHFIEICQNKKINQIEVETGWNQVASRFYKKLHFTPITQTWYKNF